MPLSRRIFWLVSTVFLVLLGLISLVIYAFFSNLLIEQTEDSLHLVMQQNQALLNSYFKRVDEISVDINNDRFLYQNLSQAVSDSFADQAISRQTLNQYLITAVYVPLRKYFNQVGYWFFIDESMPASRLVAEYSYPGNKIVASKQVESLPFYSKTIEAGGRVYWFIDPQKPGKIYAASLIRSSYSKVTISNLGILLLEFNLSDLFGSTRQAGLTGQSTYFMIDPTGKPYETLPSGSAISADWLVKALTDAAVLPPMLGRSASSFRAENHFFSVLPLNTGWLLVGITPFADIQLQTRRLSEFLLPVTLLALVAVLLLSYAIARSTSKPIADLSSVMRVSTEKGDLDVRLPAHRQTLEIAALYDSYAALIDRVKSLLQEVYEKGVSVKQAEIRTLQAQINPHFLYNTLDSINWAARDLGDHEIPAVVSSLSNILRYSIKEPDKLASLTEEMEIVRNYLDIQRFCYSLEIEIACSGDDGWQRVEVPKLTLQPIVENAILHGFLENGKKSGTIWIRINEHDGAVVCEIENEGSADIEKMNAIIHDRSETPRHGIRNVHNRLQMMFGENSGLSFYLKEDGSLVVVLKIQRQAAGKR